MVQSYKSLINLIKNTDTGFDPDKEEFALVLHDLSISDDFEGMKELLGSFAEFYLRKYPNYSGNYSYALFDAQEDLDYFCAEADKTLELKNSSEKIGYIQKFYRNSVDYRN